MCKRQIYLTCFVLMLVAVPLVTHAQVVNLVSNPSFEEDEVILDDPEWLQWATWGYEDGLDSTVEIDETEFIDGKRSLRIIPTGNTNWYFIVLNLPILVDIDKDYTNLTQLIENMRETMHQANGVGLAAPQIGKAIRLFIVDALPFSESDELEDNEKAFLKDFNRVFISDGERWSLIENCSAS